MKRALARTSLLAFGLIAALLFVAASARADEGAPDDRVVKVDLNQATVDELCELPGIGPKRAEAIVARRRARPFTRVTQLLEVKGIGGKTLARLRPLVFIGKPGRVRASRAHPLVQGAPEGTEADAGPGHGG